MCLTNSAYISSFLVCSKDDPDAVHIHVLPHHLFIIVIVIVCFELFIHIWVSLVCMTVAGMEDSDADLMMVHISDFMYACLTLMYEIGMFRLVNKTFFKINVIGTDLKHTCLCTISPMSPHTFYRGYMYCLRFILLSLLHDPSLDCFGISLAV